jgi:hypothetical protein
MGVLMKLRNARPALAAAVLLLVPIAFLFAQGNPKNKEPELRTVRGTVVDTKDNPVDTAVVYLRNVHTQDITTHLSGSDGTFRFSGLDLNVDYEIHAEHQGWTSATHSISNLDPRKEFVIELKLDHKKPSK